MIYFEGRAIDRPLPKMHTGPNFWSRLWRRLTARAQ